MTPAEVWLLIRGLVAIGALMFAASAWWRWRERSLFRPDGAREAEEAMWTALGIPSHRRPRVYYRRTSTPPYYVNVAWGTKRAGESGRGWMKVAWWDGATFAGTEMDHEGAHHALWILDGVPMGTHDEDDPRLAAYEERAQAALAAHDAG